MENQLTRAVLLPEHVARANRCLARLFGDCLISCVALLDRSGQVVTAYGDGYERERVSLGALIAGSFASAREIARLLGEEQFQTFFQQGQRHHVLTMAVGSQWLLAVVFSNKAQLGLIRVLSARAVGELIQVLRDVHRQPVPQGPVLGASFRSSANQALDVVFGESRGVVAED